MNLNVFYGILIPFIGTSAGAACVFFMKKDLNQWVQRCLTGFAAGVMVAASVWSLLIPAIEQSEGMGKLSFIPAAVGFWAGVLFLLLLDHIIPHLHQHTDKAEGPKSRLQKTTMLVLAVTLHNIPEGIAIGVPILYATGSRKKAFTYSLLSGLAEPAGALVGFLILMPFLTPFILAALFALVSGIMVYISFDELLPMAETYGKHHIALAGVLSGMVFMGLGLEISTWLSV